MGHAIMRAHCVFETRFLHQKSMVADLHDHEKILLFLTSFSDLGRLVSHLYSPHNFREIPFHVLFLHLSFLYCLKQTSSHGSGWT